MASFFQENDILSEKSAKFSGIARINGIISYEHFVNNHMLLNKPCLIGRSFLEGENWECQQWKCQRESESALKLNIKKLINRYGEALVPVAQCSKQEFDAHPKIEMKLSDYLAYLEADPTDGNFYLKDWHFQREFPNDAVYRTPVYFRSDWLNEYCDSKRADDYRFLYLGPVGSWTPFHADVFRSYSWSANVIGKKRWIILPPGEEKKLHDSRGRLPFDVRPALIGRDDVTWYDVTQEEGEVIFVPSGWHHQVHNLEMTLSINHNWYNGCNILHCWRHLVTGLRDIEKEIEEWRDSMGQDEWTQHCQMMLKSLSGMDYKDFLQMLTIVANNRMRLCEVDVTNDGDVNNDVTNDGDVNNDVTNDGDVNNDVTNDGDRNNDVTNDGDRNNDVTNDGDRNNDVTNDADVNNDGATGSNDVTNKGAMNNDVAKDDDDVNNDVIIKDPTSNDVAISNDVTSDGNVSSDVLSLGSSENHRLTSSNSVQQSENDEPWINPKFDLDRIRTVLETMLENGDFLRLVDSAREADSLLTRVCETLEFL